MRTAYPFMNIRVTSRSAIFVALLLIAIIGVLLVLQATPEGAGLSDDSIAYIAGARSMVAGHGYREAWLASNQPVTHFPPAFPAVLAFFGFLGVDPLHAARFVNALLYGLSAGLLGTLAWRMVPSLTAGLVLGGLFIFVGMAYLTRYSGLALVATFIVALVILHKSWKQRFTSIGVFIAGTLPWILGWTIRNKLVADNATNREFVWHPITPENLRIGLRTVTEAFFPVEAWRRAMIKQPYIVEGMIILILGAVLVWLAIRVWKYLSEPQSLTPDPSPRGRGEVISFTTGLYLFAYLASIISSMLMFDAATKFKLRILAPMFVCLLILLIYFGIWLRNKNRPLIVLLAFVLLAFFAYKQISTVNTLSKGAEGYASFKWYDSKTMAYLRELPTDIHIYTNEPAAVYLYTGRGNYVLPDRFDSATALPRAGFEEGVAQMRHEIFDGKAVLAIFDDADANNADAALFSEDLYLAQKSAGDTVYTAHP